MSLAIWLCPECSKGHTDPGLCPDCSSTPEMLQKRSALLDDVLTWVDELFLHSALDEDPPWIDSDGRVAEQKLRDLIGQYIEMQRMST